MSVTIIYEDNHVLIVEKPQNFAVSSIHRSRSLIHQVEAMIRKRDNIRGHIYLRPVHAVNYYAGGAVMLAKSSKAHRRLTRQVSDRQFRFKFLVVVAGRLTPQSGTVSQHIVDNPNHAGIVHPRHPKAKLYSLHYTVIDTNDEMSLVLIRHQMSKIDIIRMLLMAIGHPIMGDHPMLLNQTLKENLAFWTAYIQCGHPTKRRALFGKSYPPNTHPWSQFKSFHHLNTILYAKQQTFPH